MFPSVGLLPSLGVLDDPMFLLRVHDMLGHMSSLQNLLDLRMGPVLLLKLLAVLQRGSLPLLQHAQFLGGSGFPQPDVHLVGAGQDVAVVSGPRDARQALHALRVVDFP